MVRTWLLLTVALAGSIPTGEVMFRGPALVTLEAGFAQTGAESSKPPSDVAPSEVTGVSVEQKASQFPDGLETPLLLSLLVACALMGALFRSLWSQKSATRPPEIWRDEALFPPPRREPSRQWLSSPAFLEELRRRERVAEAEGPPRSKSAEDLIELGGDDVRSVEE